MSEYGKRIKNILNEESENIVENHILEMLSKEDIKTSIAYINNALRFNDNLEYGTISQLGWVLDKLKRLL